MKKFFLVFVCIFMMLSSSVNANSHCVQNYCPKEPYSLSGNLSGIASTVSGVNFLTRQLIEKLLVKVLKEELNSNFDVQLTTFSNNNLLNGKFKSLSIFGNNIERNGFHVSSVSAQTLCGFNHIKYEDEKLYFMENMVVKYSARITEDDLKKTLDSNEYLSSIKRAQIKSNGKVLAKISDVNVDIKDNKIVMSSEILVPILFGEIPNRIEFSAGLNVENGKIIFDDISLENSFLNIITSVLEPLSDKINPFTYKVQTKDKYDIILKVENVKITNGEIYTDGTVVIPKNYDK